MVAKAAKKEGVKIMVANEADSALMLLFYDINVEKADQPTPVSIIKLQIF